MLGVGLGIAQQIVRIMSTSGTNWFIFRQWFDEESSTYTYLVGDPQTREALLIDPVIEHAERDVKQLQALDLKLKYAMNTHLHADHITGTGLLKKLLELQAQKVQSVISKEAGATADVFVSDGDHVKCGSLVLEVRSTPGHTSGCVSYVFHEGKRVFTGDSVLIGGCGRTDFQEGDATTLYLSVHNQIFTLPEEYLIYPCHDYKDKTHTTVGEEKKNNPRLSKPLEEFKTIMSNLNLPDPRKIDVALPANKVCGLYNLSETLQKKFPK